MPYKPNSFFSALPALYVPAKGNNGFHCKKKHLYTVLLFTIKTTSYNYFIYVVRFGPYTSKVKLFSIVSHPPDSVFMTEFVNTLSFTDT